MVQADTKTSAGPQRVKIPFRLRFKAWWEGAEVVVRERQEADAGPAAPDEEPLPYEISDKYWNAGRIALVQEVWGEGLVGPGDHDRLLNLIKPLGLNPEINMLDLGAGLGGPARLYSDTFGIWVTGHETDSDLAAAGMEISTMGGFTKKAPISSFDPENLELKEKSYDRIFSKEFLFTVEDKERLFRVIETGLKDNGHILFTDYIVPDGGGQSKALDGWLKAEPVLPRPWSMEKYLKLLTALKLDIRVNEDISQETQVLISRAWANYMGKVEENGLHSKLRPILMEEAQLWARRAKLIESGQLQVCRIHAIKKTSEKLMADW